ncbi:thioredoxin family protein [uncultured Aquimarina sp.]|uniref:thioredoxin family protein n=1 Tax=uncultured Aquimarina sp. TaxID=575652 RepID=UPI002614F154|nr:thioredoxin family protein [uncultured Aquimarina sp.]
MRKTLLLLIIFQSIIGFSQSDKDCEKILSKKIELDFSNKSDLETLNNYFSKLKPCGIEQIDIALIANGPFLGTLLISLISENDGKVTYQNLFDKVIELKKRPEYAEKIKFLSIFQDLAKRKVDIKNWENDKVLFETLKAPIELVEKIHLFVKQNPNSNKTYADLLKELDDENSSKEKEKDTNKKEYDGIFKNAGNVNYEDVLKKSIELNKTLLLYFTGYACVNCRKMERSVLSDKSIKERLKNNFYLVNLYVDDKKSLPKNEWKESKNKDQLIKFVGQKHSELQFNMFNNNFQPYFVIIDKNGNKIADQNYTKDAETFADFLNKVK